MASRALKKSVKPIANLFIEPKLQDECFLDGNACPAVFTHPRHISRLRIITKRMVRLFADSEIEYSSCCGTALGCVRHHGTIPWDDDNDFFVTKETYKLLRDPAMRRKATRYGLTIHVTPMFDKLTILKITAKGKSPLRDPFIDIFGMVKRRLKGKDVLVFPPLAAAGLRLVNPVGDPYADHLLRGRDWYEEPSGRIRLKFTMFPWYDIQLPVPGDGYKYIRRTFGTKALTHAVVRVEVPMVAKHKIADLSGLYKIPYPYRPTLRNGKVVRAGEAAEYRSNSVYKSNGKLPGVANYWGGETVVMMKK